MKLLAFKTKMTCMLIMIIIGYQKVIFPYDKVDVVSSSLDICWSGPLGKDSDLIDYESVELRSQFPDSHVCGSQFCISISLLNSCTYNLLNIFVSET